MSRIRAPFWAVLAIAVGTFIIVEGAFARTPTDQQRSKSDLGKFVVHEWGTFLSVQGSNGRTLGGMVDSEENLPNFVREREMDGRNRACMYQKMETPVTYFYVDKPRSVNVRVGMKNGLLTHWYPATQSFGPPAGKENASASSSSYLDWGQVDLIPDNRVDRGPNLPTPGWKPVQPNDTWRFARETDAAFVIQRKKHVPGYTHEVTLKDGTSITGSIVREAENEIVFSNGTGKLVTVSRKHIEKTTPIRDGSTAQVQDVGEWEKFLFYRGLGSMDLPLEVRSSGFGEDVRLIMHNRGDDTLKGLFVVNIEQGKIRIASLPDLVGGGNSEIALSAVEPLRPNVSVKQIVANALVDAGLYRKEAIAMVNTWEKSYFQTDGLRVLYILPRSTVDEIIPIQIKPAPDQLERVMVGRVEVLTPETEQKLIKAVENLTRANLGLRLKGLAELGKLGRLQEPALHRVTEIAPNSEVKAQAEALIKRAVGH